MIYDKDILDAAYAKVGLFADTAWHINNNDSYIRANQELWLRERSLKDQCERIGMPRSVLDTIPESRLAEYGTYLYNEEREKCYEPINYSIPVTPAIQYTSALTASCANRRCLDEDFWLNPDVENLFCILTDTRAKTTELEDRCLDLLQGTKILNRPNFDQQNIVDTIPTSGSCASILDRSNRTLRENEMICVKKNRTDYIAAPPPRGTANTFSELVLQMQLHSEDVRALWMDTDEDISYYQQYPLLYPLHGFSATVPQFYPKFSSHTFCHGIEPGLEDDFTIDCERLVGPSINSWLNYGYPSRASDFQDVESLINEVQMVGQTTPEPQQTNQPPPPSSSPVHVQHQQQSTPESPQQQQQQQQQQSEQQLSSAQQTSPQSTSSSTINRSGRTNGAVVLREPTRRLYSAVLQNQHTAAAAAAAVATASAAPDELDELEREALEQYRPSVESLTRASDDSIISAKFHELERLALEQYSGSGSGSGSASSTETCAVGGGAAVGGALVPGNALAPPHEPPCGGKLAPHAAPLAVTNTSTRVGFYHAVATGLLTYFSHRTHLGAAVTRFR